MLSRITALSVNLVQRYLPSPFVFALLLSFVVLAASMLSTGQSLPQMAQHWGNGFWNLLTFAMQMALILVTGHALARASVLNRLLDRLARIPSTPGQAIVTVTLVASAYSGFLIWHGGLSGSIPLSLATGGADLERMSGGVLTSAIGVGQTLFTPLNLTIIALLVIGLPLLNWAMHPKQPKTADPELLVETESKALPRETAAQRLDDSRILGLITVGLALVYFIYYFANSGFVLTLNIVIGLFLFIGLLLHGSPERYTRAVQDSIGGISGIVIQFPFC